jgi:hypothetical protein
MFLHLSYDIPGILVDVYIPFSSADVDESITSNSRKRNIEFYVIESGHLTHPLKAKGTSSSSQFPYLIFVEFWILCAILNS